MPDVFPETHRWLADLVRERVSSELKLRFDSAVGWELSVAGSTRQIVIAATREPYRRLVRTLPPYTAFWDPRPEGWTAPLDLDLPIPGVESVPCPLITTIPDGYRVEFDLLWLALWALSRAEEVASTERDTHGRFPARAAHAHLHGYLSRPIVDEWFSMLRQIVQRTWPNLQVTTPNFEVDISHDVDEPRLIVGLPMRKMLSRAAGDILRRRRITRGVTLPARWFLDRAGLPFMDPFDTFSWLMTQTSERGLRSTFYFLCGHTDPRFDRSYDITESRLRSLLVEIHTRGHRIGLHPSYGSSLDRKIVRAECDHLRRTCKMLEIPLSEVGSRMHYLRWTTPDTALALSDAGVSFDCSLGYAEEIGFRCGTSIPYTAFDPVEGRSMGLRIHPLVAMDVTFLPGICMNLDASTSLRRLAELKNRCRAVGGQFTLCWHNSELDSRSKRSLFEAVLDL